MKNSTTYSKGKIIKRIACAFLALAACVCLITGALIFGGNSARDSFALDSAAAIQAAVRDAEQYAQTPTPIDIRRPSGSSETTAPSITIANKADGSSALDFSGAKYIRFTGEEGAKLIFTGKVEIPAEARVIFDVETEFTSTAKVTVAGTLIVNKRLYNAGAFTVSNKADSLAQFQSEGVIVGGSFNNDAANRGSIKVESGATFATRASTTYKTKEYNGTPSSTNQLEPTLEKSYSNNDGGALMLKASGTNLGLTGTVQNNGSVIYDKSGSTTEFSVSGNGAVSATFTTVTSTTGSNTSTFGTHSGVTVLYPSNGKEATVSLNTSGATLSGATILSFGKVTYKLSAKMTSAPFTVSGTTSLGGNILDNKGTANDASDDVYYTQGANELIFDGGAVWTEDGSADYTNTTEGDLYLHDKNGTAHKYKNDGVSGHGYTFFVVNNTFSLYHGVKITNYEHQSAKTRQYDNNNVIQSTSNNKGGGIFLSSGQTLTMYGGEVSRCVVTGIGNGSAGAGVYTAGGTITMYGGKVSYNGVNNAKDPYSWSADGAGIAVQPNGSTKGSIILRNGEISYNHSAVGGSDANADAGGLMLDDATAFIYGGSIRGNFAGGSGGGICAWCSSLFMTGGSISGNRAAYGGGIGTTSNEEHTTYCQIDGGTVSGNTAFRNYTSEAKEAWGGYGGGICLGSSVSTYGRCSELTVTGDAVISGNKAYYGGGLAVYAMSNKSGGTNNNQLTMEGGLITGNSAYTLPDSSVYNDKFDTAAEKPNAANGGGVYVEVNYMNDAVLLRPLLALSGKASIDSSNTVSFNVGKGVTVGEGADDSPIYVSGALEGSGLGALVYLSSESSWLNKSIVTFAKGLTAETYLDKFVLDSSTYSFTAGEYTVEVGTGSTNIQAIRIATATGTSVAQIVRNGTTLTPGYSTVREAISAAQAGDIIEILHSTTISSGSSYPDGQIAIDKNLTIRAASGKDVTLVVASNAKFGTSNSLFLVQNGVTLTLGAENEATGTRLTIDGNGMGRRLAQGTGSSISLVRIEGGTLLLTGNVYLRNNLTGQSGSAVFVSSGGGYFNMQGGVIEDNTSEAANGSAVFLAGGTFTWTGGTIQNNVTSSEQAQANFGVNLSGNDSKMVLNGKSTLTNNAVFLGTQPIEVEANFALASSAFPIYLQSVETLTAGNAVAKINGSLLPSGEGVTEEQRSVLDGKFIVANAQNGLTIAGRDVTDGSYTRHITIYKTTTYLLDASGGTLPTAIENNNPLAEIVDTLKESGASNVQTRNGGLILVVDVSYGSILTANGVLKACDFYLKTGYTNMGWGSYSYQSTIEYQERSTTDAISLPALWQENTYSVTFNTNAPKGTQNTATVNGAIANMTAGAAGTVKYTETAGEGKSLPASTLWATGFVFGGWQTEEKTEGSRAIFANDAVTEADLTYFDPSGTRGEFTLTAYANWVNLFASGIGTSGTPFVLQTTEHLMRLKNTVAGNAVTVTVNERNRTYYNGIESSALVQKATDYTGYYFNLGANIAFEGGISAFAGTFIGNYYEITLQKDGGSAESGLFLSLTGSVSDLILGGSVTSAATAVGALANEAIGTDTAGVTVNGVANRAAVTGSAEGAAVGGLIGSAQYLTLRNAFNYGAVSSTGANGQAGGLIGETSVFAEISNVYNTGAVSANSSTGNAGGLGGSLANTRITDAFNGGNVTASVVGAIAASSSQNAFAGVYYNSDKTASAKAIGATNSDENATALPSSQMCITAADSRPEKILFTNGWRYLVYENQEGEQNYFYPQLTTFAGRVRELSDNITVGELSQLSARLMVPKPDESGDEPLVPNKEFTVTYALNGGTLGGESTYSQTIEFKPDLKITRPAVDPVKTGYRFTGWYKNATCTELYDFSSGASAVNLTLYAGWTPEEFRFIYETNGGTELTGSYAQYVTIPVTGATTDDCTLAVGQTAANENGVYNTSRPGYYFLYWNYTYYTDNTSTTYQVDRVKIVEGGSGYVVELYNSAEGSTPVHTFSLSEISNPASAFRFSAVWQARDYKITYQYYKQVGTAEPVLLTDNVTLADRQDSYTILDYVSFGVPVLAGYEFAEWRDTSATGDRVTAIPIGSYGTRTICGIFRPNTYRITFDVREAGSLGTQSGDTFTPIPAGTTENDVEQVTVGGVTLYRPSTGLYYMEVLYREALTEAQLATVQTIAAQRTGYEFKGWYDTPNYTSGATAYNFAGGYPTRENTTVYAGYEVAKYTVTVKVDPAYGYFVKDGANVQEYTVTVEHGKSGYDQLTAPVCTGTGYYFSGWNGLENIINVTKDGEVTAVFETNGFSVVFANNGTILKTFEHVQANAKLQESQTATWNEFASGNFAQTGYRFAGWRKDNETEVRTTAQVGAMSLTGACVFTAVYEAKQVTVTYNGNDPFTEGTGDENTVPATPAAQTYSYGDYFNRLPATLTYHGYAFAGWYTAATGGTSVNTYTAIASVITDSADDTLSVTLYAHWTKETYTITYDFGAGTQNSGVTLPETYTYEDTYSAAGVVIPVENAATRTGYTLSGYSGATIANDGKLAKGTYGNLNLVASWRIEEYTVTFVADSESGEGAGYFVVPQYGNGGTYYGADGTTVITAAGAKAYSYKATALYGASATAPVSPEKNGYRFSAWDKAFTSVGGNMTVTAQYTPRSYSLTLIANGGSFGTEHTASWTAPDGIAYKAEVTVPVTGFTLNAPEGRTFAGWYDQAVGGTQYDGATKLLMPANTLVLYAHWNITSYNVTLTASGTGFSADDLLAIVNGKLGAGTAKIVNNAVCFTANHGTDLTALNGIQNDDHTQGLVWKNGASNYTFGALTENLILTASWTSRGVTITFEYYEGRSTSVFAEYSTSVPLPSNPTRNGYTFVHWLDRNNAAVEGNSVTAPAEGNDGVTYTAKWNPIQYTISYYNATDSEHGNTTKEYTVESNTITLADATRPGYTFDGWFLDDIGEKVTAIEKGSTGNKAFFAHWTAKTYTFEVHGYLENADYTEAENPAAETRTITLTYDSAEFAAFARLWTREYFSVALYFNEDHTTVFNNPSVGQQWTRVPALETMYAAEGLQKGETVALYVDYTATTYSVEYREENGTPLSESTSYKFKDEISNLGNNIVPTNPQGKTFQYWTLNGVRVSALKFEYSGNRWVVNFYHENNRVTTAEVGQIALTPYFETTKYTVTFHANDGTTATTVQKDIPYNSLRVLDENTFIRTGYTFLGWAESASATRAEYRDQAAVTLTGENTALDFYAVWGKITYSVVYELDGGSISNPPATAEIGGTLTVASPTKTGHKFVKWTLGSSVYEYTEGVTVLHISVTEGVLANATNNRLTFTAEWEANQYNVTYNANGGNFPAGTQTSYTLTYRANYPVIAAPTRLGYTFAGWVVDFDNTSVTPGGTEESAKLQTARDHNLLAQWTANTYTVTFEGTTVSATLTFGGTESVTLPSITPSTGHTAQWELAIGDNKYNPTGSVSLSQLLAWYGTEPSGTIEFQKVETPIEYTATLISNGTTVNEVKFTVVTNPAPTFPTLTRDGYDFGGWYESSAPETVLAGGAAIPQKSATYYAKWDIQSFTVTILANGGSFHDLGTDIATHKVTVTYGASVLATLYDLQTNHLNAPAGENFLYWSNSNVAGSNGHLPPLTDFEIKADTTVYAYFAANQVSIMLRYLNGDSKIEIRTLGTSYPVPAHSVIEGYSGGYKWTIFGETGEPEYTPEELTKSIILQERAIGSVQVTFDSNGGSNAVAKEVTFGETYGTLPTTAQEGYLFLGWFTAKEGGDLVTSETTVNNASTHTLYAHWQAIPYTVAFDFNGGAGQQQVVTTSMETNGHEEIALPATPTRAGYNFTGWLITGAATNLPLTAENVSLAEILRYADNTTYVITITAQWDARSYTVNYQFGGGTSTSGTSVTVTVGTSGNITLPAVTYTGHTFTGWTVTRGGEVVGSLATGDTTVTVDQIVTWALASASITITANWSLNSYTISYNLGTKFDYEIISNPNATSYNATQTVTLTDLTRTGYRFLGWFTAANGGEKVTEIALNTTGDKTFYAHWQMIEYQIVFKSNGETYKTYTNYTMTKTTAGDMEFPESPVRQGYTFGGWREKGNAAILYTASSVSFASLLNNQTGTNLEFEAIWSAAVYAIEYELNGGTNASSNPRTYRQGEGVTLVSPAKANYVFAGWYDNADFEGDAVTGIAQGDSGNKLFYAKWEKATITFAMSQEGWEYHPENANSKNPVFSGSGLQSTQFALLYGTRKNTSRTARAGAARETFRISDFDWSTTVPVTPGEYYVLAYFKFDGDNTPMPTDDDPNGWMIQKFEIAKAQNVVAVEELTVTYGDPLDFTVTRRDNATVSFLFATKMDAPENDWSAEEPENAGTYYVKAVCEDTENYTGTTSTAVKLTIAKAKLTVNAVGNGVYGNAFGEDSYHLTYSGFRGDDTESCLDGVSLPTAALSAGKHEVGVHPLTLTLRDAGSANYEFAVGSDSSYEVTRRPVSVTIQGVSSVYSAAIDLSGVTIVSDELVEGDDISAITVLGYTTTAKKESVAGGIYPITVTSYEAKNYTVTFVAGYYEIAAVRVELEIRVNNATFGDEIEPAYLYAVHASDSRADGEFIRTQLLNTEGALGFVYSGSTADDRVYATPNEVPHEAGTYYATVVSHLNSNNYSFDNASARFTIGKKTLETIVIPTMEYTGSALTPEIASSDIYEYTLGTYVNAGRYPITFTVKETHSNNYQWAAGNSMTAIFEIVRATNALKENDLTILGWTYGQYDPEVNAPTSSAAKFGTITYTYSNARDGVYTSSAPAASNAGTYWVRAEVAESANYTALLSEPVSFEIAKVRLSVPTLTIVSEGEGRNDRYTGSDLRAAINGFDSVLMTIVYDGRWDATGDDVSVVARNAATYTVRFALRTPANYCWDSEEVDEEGRVCREWTIARRKIEKPTENTDDFSLSGIVLTYLPFGFDESIMDITGNRETFNGTYTAIVTLKDTLNFEWADGTDGELRFTWAIVGVNKIFIAVVSVVGGLALCGAVFAVVQLVLYRRRKRFGKALSEEMTGASEAAISEAESEAPVSETASADSNAGSQTEESSEQLENDDLPEESSEPKSDE